MANGDRLEFEIGSDISGLERGIQDAERQLRTLERRRDNQVRIGADTSQIERQITSVQTHLNALRTGANATGGALGGMTQQVGNGSNALMQFSRIVQDAPFGIIGIGNNLTATTEAFGHLRQSTGSAGGALRAMASSLMGSGGLLLGISLLTTGLTYMAQKGLSVGDVIDKITGNFDDFGASVKKAREEGLKSAGKEIEGLRSLVAVAQNEVISKKDRLVAVEKLQSQFPAYYGNLSKEQIMYGDLTKATHEATKALIAKSIAEKLGDKAGDKFIERMAAQKKFNDAKQKIDEFDKESAKRGISDYKELTRLEWSKLSAQEKVSAQLSATRSEQRKNLVADSEAQRQSLIGVLNEYNKIIGVVDKLNETAAPLDQSAPKQAKATKQDNSGFELEKQRLQRIIEVNKKILDNENTLYYDRLSAQKAFSNATISLIDITKTKELTDSKNTENDKLRIIEDAANKTVDAKKELAERLKGIQLFSNQDFSRGNLFDSFSTNMAPSLPPIALTFTDPTEGFMAFNAKVLAGMTTTELMWQDFGIRLSDTIESGTENALIGFGESLGNALANGTNIVQSIGQSLISSLGQMISAVGKELVKMGVLAQAYAAVVKWMQKAFANPYALAAAGVALVVIGTAISGSASKVGSGGSGSTSTSSGSTANSTSRVSGGFSGGGGFGGGTVVFEIAGTSLIGVLNNTQARNLRIGGSN